MSGTQHRSRLGVFVIDCRTDDLTEAARFWSAALGRDFEIEPDGKYAAVKGDSFPRVLLQAVDHEPRVHMDIETDDREAEVERIEALGGRKIASIKGWHVMEAPTGHRFCIVRPQGDDFPGDAAIWGEGDD